MRAWLAPTAHFACIGQDVVVLDARDGTYACLVGATDIIVADDGGLDIEDPQLISELSAAGLIAFEPVEPSTRPVPPTSTAPLQPRPPRRGVEPIELLADIVAARRSLRRTSFAALLAASRRSSHTLEPRLRDALDRLCAHAGLAPFLPGEGACFERAFLRRRILARHGLSADWLFAVRTWPFTAHCWLQIDGVAIDEDLDHLASFTPIMVA